MIDFRHLSPAEEKEFRAWARGNYEPGGEINQLWHPVIRDECDRMNREKAASLPMIEVGIRGYECACPNCNYYWTMSEVPDVVTCPSCSLPFATGVIES